MRRYVMQIQNDTTKTDISWDDLISDDQLDSTTEPTDIQTAFVKSINLYGKIDLDYISSLSNATKAEVIKALDGSIYQNPEKYENDLYKGWETSEQYLSGNIYEKLRIAKKEAIKYPELFTRNVKALQNVLPDKLPIDKIYVTLGSPWLPESIINSFINHLLGSVNVSNYKSKNTRIFRDSRTGLWKIYDKNRYRFDYSNVENKGTYGTNRLTALEIIQKTLNSQDIKVYDVTSENGKKKYILNKTETVLALEKQKSIVEEFHKWIKADSDRAEYIRDLYFEKYGSIIKRNFDGSFLEFPGLSKNVILRDYQKNAVARIIFSPNTLLAHDVGSGKTLEMIAACMELKRMKLAKKVLIIVPNNIELQWLDFFEKMYEKANVLVIKPAQFRPSKKQETLKLIKDNDYDAIIMAYSSFTLIPFRDPEIDQQMIAHNTKPSYLCFQDLGIDALFVDEAHNFKNLSVCGNIQTLGITTNKSKKCEDLLNKVRYIQELDGRVVFATGTPITNSITDVYNMQFYLQAGELNLLGIKSFSDWLGMFAEKRTAFEVDVDTSGYRVVSRFSRFHNLPELATIFSSIIDLHSLKKDDLPNFSGYKDIITPKSDEFKTFLKEITQRADDIRNHEVNVKDDNMLKLTTDGRKAALDLRLVKSTASFNPESKVVKCAENVYKIYLDTSYKKSAQLVFCDVSTPKSSFNIYDELKKLLVQKGIKPAEIAFVHEATSDTRRDKLFAAVRKGTIRVLIGSTFKLGIGVNVQDQLFAIHHLDVPWRPADMVQREGRILREGNTNNYIEIYRYVTEGSFDSYSWQLLETKQSFISQLLSSSIVIRDGDDIDETVLNYSEIKALAIGDPTIKERVEIFNQLNHNKLLQKSYVLNVQRCKQELYNLPNTIKYEQEKLQNLKEDYNTYKSYKDDYDDKTKKEFRSILYEHAKHDIFQINKEVLFKYKGFEIKSPSFMKKEDPFILACSKSSEYKIALGVTENRELVHLEFFFKSMPELIKLKQENIKNLQIRGQKLSEIITQKSPYIEIISKLEERLEKIDKKLGVNENEE